MPVSIVKKHTVRLFLLLLLAFTREALAQTGDLDTQLMLATVKVSDTDSSGRPSSSAGPGLATPKPHSSS